MTDEDWKTDCVFDIVGIFRCLLRVRSVYFI